MTWHDIMQLGNPAW